MQPDTPILVVGDFNVLTGGRHRVDDPVFASDGQRYAEMRSILLGAGFGELGDYPSHLGCWEAGIDRCTMNAWGDYSMIDYAYLFDPDGAFDVDGFDLLDPLVDPDCFVTDHKGLVIDLRNASSTLSVDILPSEQITIQRSREWLR